MRMRSGARALPNRCVGPTVDPVTTRRSFLRLAAASAASAAVPARARTAEGRHEREVVTFGPRPLEDSIHERLNALIARLSADGGGTVRMAEGVYPTAAQIQLIDNVRLIGAGPPGEGPQTVIRLTDAAPSMQGKAGIIRAKRDGVPLHRRIVHGVALEDLIIDGNRHGQRQDMSDEEKKYGIYAEAHDMVMRRVTTRFCMGYGFDPHGTADNRPSERLLIEDCYSHGNQKDGFTLDFQLDMVVRRCLSEDNDRSGFNFTTSTRETRLEDCLARRNGANGIVIQNETGRVTLANNEVTDNRLNGIYLRDAHEMLVTGNHVHGNDLAGIRVRGGRDVEIAGNRVERNQADGKTSQGEIFLDDWRGRDAARVTISANRIRALRTAAVVEAAAEGTVIRDNIIHPVNGKILLSSTDAVVEGNRLLR